MKAIDQPSVVPIDVHTEFILAIVFVILCLVIVGIPLLLGLLVVSFVFPILAAVKVQNGETWIYPFSFKFLKLDF